jgi:hypothetical protein
MSFSFAALSCLLQSYIEHVHRPEAQRHGVIGMCEGGLTEFFGYLAFRATEDDAGLPFPFSLGVHGDGVFQGGGDQDVLDFHRIDGNTPGSVCWSTFR